jgi:hypothetical protein
MRLAKSLFLTIHERRGRPVLDASAVERLREVRAAKKSPYHKDTGIPELLLPRCANGSY